MSVEAGKVAIVRFPRDQLPIPAVAMVHTYRVAKVNAYRYGEALVSKHMGPRRRDRWGKARWVPTEDIVREATPREQQVGAVIDPLPPRAP